MKQFKNCQVPKNLKSNSLLELKKATSRRSNTILYFQIGLVLSLLTVYYLFEMEFEQDIMNLPELVTIDDSDLLVIPFIQEEEPKTKTGDRPAMNDKPKSIEPRITDPVVDDPVYQTLLFTEPAEVLPGLIDPDLSGLEERPEDEMFPVICVEKVPIYPGCESLVSNPERLDCMSEKLGRLVNKNFNTDLSSTLGLTSAERIIVYFRISKDGEVTDIRVRNSMPALQKEAVRVAGKIPKMKPAEQSSRKVAVMYALPIILDVKN